MTRVNKKKEFFNISINEAISVIERIGEPYKMSEDESSTQRYKIKTSTQSNWRINKGYICII